MLLEALTINSRLSEHRSSGTLDANNKGATTGASTITVKRALNSFGGTIVSSQHSVSPPVRYRDGPSVKYGRGRLST